MPLLGLWELMQIEYEATLDLQILLLLLVEGSSMSLLELALCSINLLIMFILPIVGCLGIEIAGALYFRWRKLDFVGQFADFETFIGFGFKTGFINFIDSSLESFISFLNYWSTSQDFMLDYHLESFLQKENLIILYQFVLVNLFS